MGPPWLDKATRKGEQRDTHENVALPRKKKNDKLEYEKYSDLNKNVDCEVISF